MIYEGFILKFIDEHFSTYQEGIDWVKKCQKGQLSDDDANISAFAAYIILEPNFPPVENGSIFTLSIDKISSSQPDAVLAVRQVLVGFKNERKATSIPVITKEGAEILVPRKFFTKETKKYLKPGEKIQLPNVSKDVLSGMIDQIQNRVIDEDFVKFYMVEIAELQKVCRYFSSFVQKFQAIILNTNPPLKGVIFAACLKLCPTQVFARTFVDRVLKEEFKSKDLSVEYSTIRSKICVTLTNPTPEALSLLKLALTTFDDLAVSMHNREYIPKHYELLFSMFSSSPNIKWLIFAYTLGESFNILLKCLKEHQFLEGIHMPFVDLLRSTFTSNEDLEKLFNTIEERPTHTELSGAVYWKYSSAIQLRIYAHDSRFLQSIRGIVALCRSANPAIEELHRLLEAIPTNKILARCVLHFYEVFNNAVTSDVLRNFPEALNAYRNFVKQFPLKDKPLILIEYTRPSLERKVAEKRRISTLDAKLVSAHIPFLEEEIQRRELCMEYSPETDKILTYFETGFIPLHTLDETLFYYKYASKMLIPSLIDKCRDRIKELILNAQSMRARNQLFEIIYDLRDPNLRLWLKQNKDKLPVLPPTSPILVYYPERDN